MWGNRERRGIWKRENKIKGWLWRKDKKCEFWRENKRRKGKGGSEWEERVWEHILWTRSMSILWRNYASSELKGIPRCLIFEDIYIEEKVQGGKGVFFLQTLLDCPSLLFFHFISLYFFYHLHLYFLFYYSFIVSW